VIQKIKTWWLVSLLVKLAISAFLPLSSDEAYYWVWSKNLQLSYFDHPAMVSWLFKLGEPFEFLGQAVRWPAVLLGHLTIIVWLLILRPIVKEETLFYWFLLCLFAPLTGFGSMIVTPDLPVLFFWALSIWSLKNALDKPNVFNAALLGASLGLGFCSKYHIVLFVPCALFYIIAEKLWRKINFQSILVVILFGAVFSTPVLYWNYQNSFSSFLFQINHGLNRPTWEPFWTYSYIIGQALLIFPIPLVLAIRAKLDSKQRFLIYFSWIPLGFFMLSSTKALVEMNWPIIAYPSFYALAAIGAKSLRPIKSTVAIWGLAAVLVLFQAIYPSADPAIDKLKEIHKFDQIISVAPKYKPFFAETYQMASAIWYKTKTPTYKLHQMSRHDFYDSLTEGIPTTNTFYIAMDKTSGYPNWVSDQGFHATVVEELNDPFVIVRLSKK